MDDFARYLYLPRVAGPEVLTRAMGDGVALLTWRADGFGYAESFDDKAARYRGLRGGQMVTIGANDAGLLVKPEIARVQLDAEVAQPPTTGPGTPPGPGPSKPGPRSTNEPEPPALPVAPPPRVLRCLHGSVGLDAARVGRDAGRIAEEVLAHLSSQPGAEVTVSLEIEVCLPAGAS